MKRMLLTLLGVAIAVAPSAQADDAGFVAALDKAGINYASPSDAVNLGETICDALRVSASMDDIATAVIRGGYSPIEAGVIVSSSAVYLCPDQSIKIPTVLRT